MCCAGGEPGICEIHIGGGKPPQGVGDHPRLRYLYSGILNDRRQRGHYGGTILLVAPNEHINRFSHGQAVEVQPKFSAFRRCQQRSGRPTLLRIVLDDLDLSRGALTVEVEGNGSKWQHETDLPFVTLRLRSGGQAEVASTSAIFADSEGVGSRLQVGTRLVGLGRIGPGSTWECAQALQSGAVQIEGGTWIVRGTYVNQGSDLTVTGGGRLKAQAIRGGEFSTRSVIEGSGSVVEAVDLIRPVGGVEIGSGGAMSVAYAELFAGGISVQTEGVFRVAGDLYANAGVSIFNRGSCLAGEVFLGDTAGRSGFMQVRDAGSTAVVGGALAVGQVGEGQLNVVNGGRLDSGLAGFGVLAGASGQGMVSGVGSEWSVRPVVGGGALLIGGAGRGELRIDSGGVLRVTALGDVEVGRDAASDGLLRVAGAASHAEMDLANLRVGAAGRGRVMIEDAAGLSVLRLVVGSQGHIDGRGGRTRVGGSEYPGAGVVRVGAGGRLIGSGRVSGIVEVVAGGVVSPGASPGRLTIDGELRLQTGSGVEIEIGGPGVAVEHDPVDVNGAARLGGELVLRFVDGFAPSRGQAFNVLHATGLVEGTFATVRVEGLEPGFVHRVARAEGGQWQVIAENDGVASSLPVLAHRRSGGALELSWWVTARATLETRPLAGGEWEPVAGVVQGVGDRNVLQVSLDGPGRIFRLRR